MFPNINIKYRYKSSAKRCILIFGSCNFQFFTVIYKPRISRAKDRHRRIGKLIFEIFKTCETFAHFSVQSTTLKPMAIGAHTVKIKFVIIHAARIVYNISAFFPREYGRDFLIFPANLIFEAVCIRSSANLTCQYMLAGVCRDAKSLFFHQCTAQAHCMDSATACLQTGIYCP